MSGEHFSTVKSGHFGINLQVNSVMTWRDSINANGTLSVMQYSMQEEEYAGDGSLVVIESGKITRLLLASLA